MNLGGVVHLNKTGLCICCALCVLLFYYVAFNRSPTVDPTIHEDQIDLKKLLSVAIKAAQNGGDEILALKGKVKIESKGKTKEGANDSVTTADFRSHCSMKVTFKHYFPDLSVVSEESKAMCDVGQYVDFSKPQNVDLGGLHETWINEKDVVVWIDPLDATQEYTEQLHKYVTTMVCVAVKGTPVIGVIHKPYSEETSWAWLGNGKSVNLNVGQNSNEVKLKFIVSRSHSGKVKEILKDSFKGKDVEIIPAGGAGYKVLEVVKGNANAYVHTTAIKKWDICAGNAILNSVGGKMTTKNNNVITYSDIDDVVNEQGLIATLKNHDSFIGKI